MADIGCDHGLLSVGLSQHCSKVWAIDVSALAIQGEYFGISIQSKTSNIIKDNVCCRRALGLYGHIGNSFIPLLTTLAYD